MNFTISKADLNEALHKVIGVVPQKTTIPILSCILLDLQGDRLNLTGTDLEISITTSSTVKSSEDGSAAIPARLLSDIVRELPDVPLTISSESANKILLKTDKGEYKISTQLREDFPKITVEEGDFALQLDSENLARLVDKTAFAVSTDELRPALTGINMEIFSNELRFVATDGHRLSRVISKDFKIADQFQRNLIIPTKTLNLLVKNLAGTEKVNVQVGEDHIVFTLNNTIIYSKLIAGSYPNYERVIPIDNDKKLQINRELLISTLRRVSVFSNLLTHQVRLVMTPNELTVKSEDVEYGAEGKESMPASFSADWLQVGYNCTYLLDILRHLDGEEIVFEVKDSTSAGIVYPSEQKKNESVVMLIMPIRISEEATEAEEEEAPEETEEAPPDSGEIEIS
jgi:DNA polymerase-3 subunit beta